MRDGSKLSWVRTIPSSSKVLDGRPYSAAFPRDDSDDVHDHDNSDTSSIDSSNASAIASVNADLPLSHPKFRSGWLQELSEFHEPERSHTRMSLQNRSIDFTCFTSDAVMYGVLQEMCLSINRHIATTGIGYMVNTSDESDGHNVTLVIIHNKYRNKGLNEILPVELVLEANKEIVPHEEFTATYHNNESKEYMPRTPKKKQKPSRTI